MKFLFCWWCFWLAVSPPSRGAWIEMIEILLVLRQRGVAPLAGGVD